MPCECSVPSVTLDRSFYALPKPRTLLSRGLGKSLLLAGPYLRVLPLGARGQATRAYPTVAWRCDPPSRTLCPLSAHALRWPEIPL